MAEPGAEGDRPRSPDQLASPEGPRPPHGRSGMPAEDSAHRAVHRLREPGHPHRALGRAVRPRSRRSTACSTRARSCSAAPTATGPRFTQATAQPARARRGAIDVPPSTRSGKNGADMRLVIDALELGYLREHIDTFVIASGDSDFCPLAYKLREIGRTVIGMAVREATSPLFVKACDEFIYLAPGPRPARARAAAEGAGDARRPPRRRRRDPGDRPRGRRRDPGPRHRAREPVGDQGVHRPQGARLRRARARLLAPSRSCSRRWRRKAS